MHLAFVPIARLLRCIQHGAIAPLNGQMLWSLWTGFWQQLLLAHVAVRQRGEQLVAAQVCIWQCAEICSSCTWTSVAGTVQRTPNKISRAVAAVAAARQPCRPSNELLVHGAPCIVQEKHTHMQRTVCGKRHACMALHIAPSFA